MVEPDEVRVLPRRPDPLDLDRGWLPVTFLALVVSLPIVLAAVDAIRSGWVPASDSGTIALRAFDMWGWGRPLVGQFSLAGPDGGDQVFSPGPMLYALLAPAARFGPAWAMPATLAVASSGCFALALVAARRIGGWWFSVLVGAGLLATMGTSGASAFVEVWNPWAALAPFAALVMVCWYTALGHRWWLAVAVVLASFAVQAHLTYLVPSAGLLLVAAVGAWWPQRSPAAESPSEASGPGGASSLPAPTGRWAPALAALGIGLAAWAAPLVQQFRSSPGNLELLTGAAQDGGATWGTAVGINVWWRSSGVIPAFAFKRISQSAELAELGAGAGIGAWFGVAVATLVLIGVGWVAVRRSQRDVVVGVVLSLGLGAAAVVTAARIPLTKIIVAPYALRWTVTAGLVPWAAMALAGRRLLRLPAWVTRPAGVASGVAPLVVLLAVALTVPRSDPSAWATLPARDAGEAIVEATAPGDRVLLADSGPYDVVMTPALAWSLRRAGRLPVLVRDAQLAAGDAYAVRGLPCDAVVALRPTSEPAQPGSETLTVVVLDGPGPPERVAVDLVPDTSADGRC